MNKVLLLSNAFIHENNKARIIPTNIPKTKKVNINHLIKLKEDLINVNIFWKKQKLDVNPILSVYYNELIAKSNRIKSLLEISTLKNNEAVVGSRFDDFNSQPKSVITYCVKKSVILDAIKRIDDIIDIWSTHFSNQITYEDINDINQKKYDDIFKKSNISKTTFTNTIVDAYYVNQIMVDTYNQDFNGNCIITFYDTKTNIKELLKQLDINLWDNQILDNNVFLNQQQYNVLKNKAPFLISMGVSDLSEFSLNTSNDVFLKNKKMQIKEPSNEPVVGVIDSVFNNNVYFDKWVEDYDLVDKNIVDDNNNYHGTSVTSIIVDGANLNKNLDDGCGNFKVRHFGVLKGNMVSSFSIIRHIKKIIEENKDIKVWNLSLGSMLAIEENSISPIAAFLDKLQNENDIIFIVAATNKSSKNKHIKKIGEPADSINSIVVGSVGFDNQPTNYSRCGPVLSFFRKPDVCYYGGDAKNPIKTYCELGIKEECGTSYAAAWITRKVAYLIEVLKLTKEEVKALIVDSATNWEDDKISDYLGYGVVPININDIVNTKNDEIKFIIKYTSKKYNTYNHKLPIPFEKDKHPFVAKLTLCYFPKTNRSQGVDYTNTELDIHFGRLKIDESSKVHIKSINNNNQSEEIQEHQSNFCNLKESKVRLKYRKWDNTKHIKETLITNKNNKIKARKKLNENGYWGISIKSKQRLNNDNEKLAFAIVISLKELNNKNRIQDFVKLVHSTGWNIKEIDINNEIYINNKINEEIEFD